ncbi:MAG: sugar phosphate isomerase/epimerase, partial [Victivallaceae bacterium]
NPESTVYEYAEALHTPAVTISAFIDFASEYGKLRETCVNIGRIAERHGTVFSYHNHWLEFTKVDGIPAMERILENTSPENVFLEPDVCWLTRAGVNPSDYLRKYARRIRQIHMKDIRAPEEPETTTELGKGVIDLKSAYKTALETSCEWLIYEQDYAKNPFESAVISIEYLKKMQRNT